MATYYVSVFRSEYEEEPRKFDTLEGAVRYFFTIFKKITKETTSMYLDKYYENSEFTTKLKSKEILAWRSPDHMEFTNDK